MISLKVKVLVSVFLLLAALYPISNYIANDTSREYIIAAMIVGLSWSFASILHLFKSFGFIIVFFLSSVVRIIIIVATIFAAIKLYSVPSTSLLLWAAVVYLILLTAETIFYIGSLRQYELTESLFTNIGNEFNINNSQSIRRDSH